MALHDGGAGGRTRGVSTVHALWSSVRIDMRTGMRIDMRAVMRARMRSACATRRWKALVEAVLTY